MKYLKKFESYTEIPKSLYVLKNIRKYIPRTYFKIYDILEIIGFEKGYIVKVKSKRKSDDLIFTDRIELNHNLDYIIQKERDINISKLT